ncbi:nuclear transport factor 2 family protein [Natronolimnohabitans innermongolicus]|uniref:SnoaL-like domain-containing protein n=1 Tax=Natronolimnohabitans innermongolicus JCM 12255 TaxID=1227499 RepID=L9WQ63_9EURY|nr:nuclear transport factor 2 family protein [Natronolimnohabitans innermongolicus]ELY51635.1 hypothetical protein C493_16936 [Natronolimnohabitans innermongolicus JCM 12255]
MSDRAESVVRDYYDALCEGDPLAPYFLEGDSTVKFGLSEGLFGYADVAAALKDQTESTANWSVESGHLVVDEREAFATFADEVTMAWTDAETGENRRFETRWSGTLVRREPDGRSDDSGGNDGSDTDGDDTVPAWRFAAMHVSTADEL